MMILYQRTDCPFCWKVRLALEELSVSYESVETRLGEKHPEVLRLSPTGTVPVLVDGDTVIWESSVILDYLDRSHAPGVLVPDQAAEEASVRLLHAYSDKQLGSCLFKLVAEKRSKPEEEWDRDTLAEAQENWQQCQAWLEPYLEGREFFGPRFGAADCALATRCGVAAAYGEPVSEKYGNLHRWYQAAKARPAWAKAYPTTFIRSN